MSSNIYLFEFLSTIYLYMLLTESYKKRLQVLAGINPEEPIIDLIEEGKFSSVYDLTKDQFLGKPTITTNANAKFLKPSELTTLQDVPKEPFLKGKYTVKLNEDGGVVFDGEKIIASYHFGDTLVVDKKYRGLGIAKELVYQWRKRYPDVAQASSRTKASQAIQKSVWNRIENDKFRDEFINKKITEEIGITPDGPITILKEARDLYINSSKRVKFDINIMKQAIEGGMEVGLVFQSNNEKYKMPIWKMRVIQPVAMGYDKKGNLVIRGIHVTGQSEKKAIETGVRSAEAKNEWRLFKSSNIKSMFLTGRLFKKVSLPGYNPNDSAMTSVIAAFNPAKATVYQKQLNIGNEKEVTPVEPATTQTKPAAPAVKPAVQTKKPAFIRPKQTNQKSKEDSAKLQQKIDKLNKLF